jgi:hypothetical protein
MWCVDCRKPYEVHALIARFIDDSVDGTSRSSPGANGFGR